MTQQAKPPPAIGPAEAIAKRVKELRRERGWSAAQLAERMRTVGINWNRNIVANLETGRRPSVDVAELLALGWVLGVEPAYLLVPPDLDEQPYRVTPSSVKPAVEVREWIKGRTDEWVRLSQQLGKSRQAFQAVLDYMERVEQELAEHRDTGIGEPIRRHHDVPIEEPLVYDAEQLGERERDRAAEPEPADG